MELAVPFIALSSMYVISNQNKKKEDGSESFVNMGKPVNYLPNINEPIENYPVLNKSEVNNLGNSYPSNVQSTNDYLNQNEYYKKEKEGVKVGTNVQQIHSLNGNTVPINDFVHNNMVPINGKTREHNYNNNNTSSILDNYNGKGTQYLRKTEQAPLFKPHNDVQWTNGMPNMSNFLQSRVNPSMKNNMVKPFETVKVGRGQEGESRDGCKGYNLGMNDREKWMPKTVDELRAINNPKEERIILSHEGPANSQIKNRGIQGEVQKNNPDTYYVNSKDRWFTTTGIEVSGPAHGTQIVKHSNRNELSAPVVGHANSAHRTASVAPKIYSDPKRFAVDSSDFVPPSFAGDKGGLKNRDSYSLYANNRAINCQPDNFGALFSKSIGAVVAPVLDYIKPCRKEEHVCNARVFGNMGTGEISAGYTEHPNKPKITTKETTMYSSNGFVANHTNNAYHTVKHEIGQTQRDTTGNCGYVGGVGGTGNTMGQMVYDSVYNHTIDDKKEISVNSSRAPSGNTQIFNPNQNVLVSKPDVKECTNLMPPSSSRGPNMETHGQIREVKEYDHQTYQDSRTDPQIISALKGNPYTHVYVK